MLSLVASLVLASPTPSTWANYAPGHVRAELALALTVLEVAALLYFSLVLKQRARHALAAAMRLVPKAATVLIALALQPNAQLAFGVTMHSSKLGDNASVAIVLAWNSTVYALPMHLHVPVVLLEWLLLSCMVKYNNHAPVCPGSTALLQATLAVVATAPLAVLAQHLMAKAQAMQLERGPSGTPMVEISLAPMGNQHDSISYMGTRSMKLHTKGGSSTSSSSKGHALHRILPAEAITSTATYSTWASEDGKPHTSPETATPPAAVPALDACTSPAAGLRAYTTQISSSHELHFGESLPAAAPAQARTTLADHVLESLQLAAAAMARRSKQQAADEALQRELALQHVAALMGSDVAGMVAASAAGTAGGPLHYVGRCRVEPVGIQVRQPVLAGAAVGDEDDAAAQFVASVVTAALEATVTAAAVSSVLPWHLHATCIAGSRRAYGIGAEGSDFQGLGAATAPSRLQHERLMAHVNDFLAAGPHTVHAPFG